MTETKTTEQELRQKAAEALAEADRLARRIGVIDQEIESERQAISQQRIAAAKMGESPLAAVDRVGLQGLQAERDELPELLFAARLYAASLQVSAEGARIAELTPEIEEAEAELAPLVRAANEAQARADGAAHRLNDLEGALVYSRERSREQQRLLAAIEEEGPKPLLP